MKFKKTFLTLIVAMMMLASMTAQAATCNGNWVSMNVPTGYRGVDCTYTVYVNGAEVYSGTTGGANCIKVPDYGNCSYKVVYGEAAAEATAAPAATTAAGNSGSSSSCPPTTKYTRKPTGTQKATVAPTAQPTAAPTATTAATVKPTAAPTAKPTAVPTVKPTAKPTSNGSTSSSLASQVVALVNEYRAQYGLSPLSVDSDLTSAAAIRAKECATSFSHTRPDGSSWSTVSSKARGENIAMGYKTAEKVMAAWMTSEGHRANILRESFTTIGVSAYEVNGVVYWAQEFGTN